MRCGCCKFAFKFKEDDSQIHFLHSTHKHAHTHMHSKLTFVGKACAVVCLCVCVCLHGISDEIHGCSKNLMLMMLFLSSLSPSFFLSTWLAVTLPRFLLLGFLRVCFQNTLVVFVVVAAGVFHLTYE